MGQWVDKDGDKWDRMCSYCTHRHDGSRMVYTCKRQSADAFRRNSGMRGDNGCPDFHTSDRIGWPAMPRDNQGRPPANNEGRVEHSTKRPVERDPVDQARQDTKDKTRKLTR